MPTRILFKSFADEINIRIRQALSNTTDSIGFILLFICILMCKHISFSQVTIGDIDRAAPVGARTAALGDGYVSTASDAGDVFGNPATLAFLPGSSAFASHSMQRKDRMMSENGALAFTWDSGKAVGIGFSIAHTGYVRDSPRAPLRVLQYFSGVGYAQKITTWLSAGGVLGVRHAESSGYHLTEFTPSVGLFYYPLPGISYGVVYSHQGSFLQYTYNDSSSVWKSESSRHSLQAGASLRLRLWRREPTMTLALTNEKIFGTTGLIYKGGVEVQPIQTFAFRIAYFVAPNQTYAKFGFGINLMPLRIDYAIAPSQVSDRMHDITVVFEF